MNVTVLDFFMRTVDCGEFNDKRVLEVGSRFVNGSVRPLIERFCRPREYVGVDIEAGKRGRCSAGGKARRAFRA